MQVFGAATAAAAEDGAALEVSQVAALGRSLAGSALVALAPLDAAVAAHTSGSVALACSMALARSVAVARGCSLAAVVQSEGANAAPTPLPVATLLNLGRAHTGKLKIRGILLVPAAHMTAHQVRGGNCISCAELTLRGCRHFRAPGQ
jgi:hypothetical protein